MGIASKKRSRKQATLLAAAIGAGALFTHFAEGATFTWDGGGSGTNWTTAGNWTGAGGGVGPSGSGYDVLFGTAGSGAVVNSNQTINGLYFNRSADFSVSGSSSLTLNLINAAAPSVTGRTYSISAALTLGVNNTWNVDSSVGDTTLTVSSIISDSVTAKNLTKIGSGLLVLSNAANTYSGVTTINGGTLSINTLANGGSSSGIGDAASAAGNLIIDGGALRFTGFGDTTNRLFTLGANGGIIEVNSGNATFSGSGAILFTGTGDRTLTLSGNNVGTFAPVLGDNGADVTSLTKSGSGSWSITGANTYTGHTTIEGGTLIVSTVSGASSNLGAAASDIILNGGVLRFTGATATNAHAFTLGANGGEFEASGSGTLTVSGAMSASALTGSQTLTIGGTNTGSNTLSSVIANGGGANVTNLEKEDSSRWVLNAANTYTGSTIISGGTLAYGVSDALSDSSYVTLGSGTSVLDLGSNRSDTVGGLSLVNGSILGSTSTLTLNAGSYDIRSGTISTALRGSAALTKTTSGTATIAIASGYSGATSITGGTLVLGTSGALASTGSVTVNGSTAVLDLGNNRTLTQAGVVLDGDATITGTGTSALTLSAGSYDLRNGSVSIPLKGSVGLEKTTSGTVTLTSGNSLTGAVNVRGGTLKLINAEGTLAAATSVRIHNGGTLQLDNTVSAEINNDRIGAVDVSLLGGMLHYLGDDGSTYSDETVSRLVVSEGASTLSIDGASSNGNGSTHAVINFNNGNSSADLVRSVGSTLRFVNDVNNRAEAVVTNFIETNGIIGGWALYGDGTFAALGGSNTGSITAATVDNTSTVTSSWTAAQNVRLTSGATSTVNPSGSSITVNSLALATSNATISISSNKSLVVETGGIALATASHLITGTGSITAGASSGYELVVHNNSANIGTIAATIANNGINAMTLTKGGTGHLRLTGANTYTGPTYIAAGTLSLAATNNNIASSSFISVQNGATLNVASISSGFRLGANQKLKGSGSVVGNVTVDAVGSTIAPGNSPGKLTFVNTLTLTPTATYEAQIGGTGTGTGTAGIDFDQILLSGSASSVVLGSAQLKILPMPGIVIGQPYRIVATTGNASVVGSQIFKNLTQNLNAGGPYTQGNVTFNIDYGYGSGGYVDVTFSAVPEPSSLSVLALGACGLLKRRRRASTR